MLFGHFNLNSGRLVSIEKLWMTETYAGILEGERHYISQRVKERTPAQLREQHGIDVAILFPNEELLPRYRFVAQLESDALPDQMQWRLDCIRKDLPLGYHWDFSFVLVCWYQHSIDGNLIEFVRAGTCALDWKKYAKNTRCD